MIKLEIDELEDSQNHHIYIIFVKFLHLQINCNFAKNGQNICLALVRFFGVSFLL
jgi:hypothetical protein